MMAGEDLLRLPTGRSPRFISGRDLSRLDNTPRGYKDFLWNDTLANSCGPRA